MWLRGEEAGFSWCAKVYDAPSHLGINNGRVSKFELRDDAGRWVAQYDRGWSVQPHDEETAELMFGILRQWDDD